MSNRTPSAKSRVTNVNGTPTTKHPQVQNQPQRGYKKSDCPITRSQFREEATEVLVREAFNVAGVPTKVFSTGSYGWYLAEKVDVLVGETKVKCQASISLQLIGSKEGDRRKCPVSLSKFEEEASQLSMEAFGDLRVPVKEFSTGTLGWYYSGKMPVEVAGYRITCQVQISLYIVNSKELPQDDEE